MLVSWEKFWKSLRQQFPEPAIIAWRLLTLGTTTLTGGDAGEILRLRRNAWLREEREPAQETIAVEQLIRFFLTFLFLGANTSFRHTLSEEILAHSLAQVAQAQTRSDTETAIESSSKHTPQSGIHCTGFGCRYVISIGLSGTVTSSACCRK
jgi:hypothetical protein